MAINAATVAHRWANKDFGRNGTLTAGNCSCSGRNYYSYSTVFGQWLDLKKNVVLVFDGSTSSTSSKHKLYKGDFPKDVHVFPYNDGGGYRHWSGCELVSWLREDEDFKLNHKMELLDYYVQKQLDAFRKIAECRGKNLHHVSYLYWEYFEELCSLYKKELSLTKYVKFVKSLGQDKNMNLNLRRKLAKMLGKGIRDAGEIVDSLFGDGTYDKYTKYNSRFEKADATKQHIINICRYLRCDNPYEGCYCNSLTAVRWGLSVSQIRALTAKERLDIKFSNLRVLENRANMDAINEAAKKRRDNAFRYVTGHNSKNQNVYGIPAETYYVHYCTNRFTGETYDLTYAVPYVYMPIADLKLRVDFDYNGFSGAKDKEAWMREFYEQCRIASDARQAISILVRIDAGHIPWRYGQERWVATDRFKALLTDDEMALCLWYINLQESAVERKMAEERAWVIARDKEEAEMERERELQRQLKQEAIDKCLSEGEEGARQLWRKHYMPVYEALDKSCLKDEVFFNGGNVLLRFNLDKNIVETSKRIRLDIPTCKKLWRMVSIWHTDPKKFKETVVKTHYSGTYRISSYENDVLTAGCHDISYAEMERMYNEIIENENGNGDKNV